MLCDYSIYVKKILNRNNKLFLLRDFISLGHWSLYYLLIKKRKKNQGFIFKIQQDLFIVKLLNFLNYEYWFFHLSLNTKYI